jgi:hypothetical protein
MLTYISDGVLSQSKLKGKGWENVNKKVSAILMVFSNSYFVIWCFFHFDWILLADNKNPFMPILFYPGDMLGCLCQLPHILMSIYLLLVFFQLLKL